MRVWNGWNTGTFELKFQAFLVDGFQEAGTLVLIDFVKATSVA